MSTHSSNEQTTASEEAFETNEGPIDIFANTKDKLEQAVNKQRKSHTTIIDRTVKLSEIKTDIHKCENPDCEKLTNRNSGFCMECEKVLGPFLNTEVLHCVQCFVANTCPEGRNKWGTCVYELEADNSNMKERDAIENEMRLVLQRDKKLVERLSRYVSSLDLTEVLGKSEFLVVLKELKQWQQLFLEHLRVYSTFKGWNQMERGDIEALKVRVGALNRVIGRQVGKVAYKDIPKNMEDTELKPLIINNTISSKVEDRPVITISTNQDVTVDDIESDINASDLTVNDDLLKLEQIEANYQEAKSNPLVRKLSSDSKGVEEDDLSDQSEDTTSDSE